MWGLLNVLILAPFCMNGAQFIKAQDHHRADSIVVSDELAPAQHTLTPHHVIVTAVLRMIHRPNNGGSVGILLKIRVTEG